MKDQVLQIYRYITVMFLNGRQKEWQNSGWQLQNQFSWGKDGHPFDDLIEKERKDFWNYAGRTVLGKSKPPHTISKGVQLRLF